MGREVAILLEKKNCTNCVGFLYVVVVRLYLSAEFSRDGYGQLPTYPSPKT